MGAVGPSLPPRHPPQPPTALQVLDELMSGNPHLEKESLRAIAEGAMLEAASACMARTVRGCTAPCGVAQQGRMGPRVQL